MHILGRMDLVGYAYALHYRVLPTPHVTAKLVLSRRPQRAEIERADRDR
jgi:hypothetical protein